MRVRRRYGMSDIPKMMPVILCSKRGSVRWDSDELVWSRALKSFQAKNGHLIRYGRFASQSLQRDLDELASVYRRPSRVEGDHHRVSNRHTDILVAGLTRLAQLNPNRAYQAMMSR